MNAKDAIRAASQVSSIVMKTYIADLSDADLMQRPGPGCNHLAWQLGHLISSECSLLDMVQPGTSIKLPEGFAAMHNKETAGSDDPHKFRTKQEYLDLMDKAQAATFAALENVSDSDLDKAGPEAFRQMFPTMGHVYMLIATHHLMHAGQFVPVRRKLGKPIVI